MSKDFYDAMIDTIDSRQGLWKDASRSSGLIRSNKAHQRLETKHMKTGNYRLMQYHNRIAFEQSQQNRVLSRFERKSIFKM